MIKSTDKAVTRDSHTGRFRAEPSPKDLRAEMRTFAGDLKKSKTEAHKFLVNAGIVTPKGNLRKVYGG